MRRASRGVWCETTGPLRPLSRRASAKRDGEATHTDDVVLAERAGRARAHLPAADGRGDGARPARPHPGGRGGGAERRGLPGDRLPLLPQPEQARHRSARGGAAPGSHVRAAVRRRARPPARTVREYLPALHRVRTAHARRAPARPRARVARALRAARGGAVPPRPSPRPPASRRRAAEGKARREGLRAAAEGAVAHLRNRAVRRAEGHLGRERARSRDALALDARCARRDLAPPGRGRARGAPQGARTMKILSPLDVVGLVVFAVCWWGYPWYAERRERHTPGLVQLTNRYRYEWMRQMLARDMRMVDTALVNTLTQSSVFFSSTTVLILGGLLALVGTSETMQSALGKLPGAVPTSEQLWELKLLLLVSIFVYAFFKFTWSLRQFNFVGILVGAAPPREASPEEDVWQRAGAMAVLAAEDFNQGLRAYYFAFAAISWFVNPTIFIVASVVVVGILYVLEFRSNAVKVLGGGSSTANDR